MTDTNKQEYWAQLHHDLLDRIRSEWPTTYHHLGPSLEEVEPPRRQLILTLQDAIQQDFSDRGIRKAPPSEWTLTRVLHAGFTRHTQDRTLDLFAQYLGYRSFSHYQSMLDKKPRPLTLLSDGGSRRELFWQRFSWLWWMLLGAGLMWLMMQGVEWG